MNLFEDVFDFIRLLCRAKEGKPLHLAMGEIRDSDLYCRERWCGSCPTGETTADWVASAKLHELYWLQRNQGECKENEFRFTPVLVFPRSVNFRGGVQRGKILVGASNWDENHDLMMALVALYFANNDIFQFHHIITIRGDRESAIAAAGKDSFFVKNGLSHRWFQKVVDGMLPHQYYCEERFYPDFKTKKAVIFDLWGTRPHAFVNYLAAALEQAGVSYNVETENFGSETRPPQARILVPGNKYGLGFEVRTKPWIIF